MEQHTNGTHGDSFKFIVPPQPYTTREEWDVFTAALKTYIDMNRRADLMRVEAAEMLAAAIGKPYKRPKR